MNEISPMVTMLAERMRTNPEDFVSSDNKSLVGSTPPKFYEISQLLADMIADPNAKYYWFLNDTERGMLMDAYCDLCRKRFEDRCLEKLLGDKQEHEGPASVKYKAQGRYGQAQVTGQGQPVNYGWYDPRMAMQRKDLLRQQEDLIRVSASENGINQIQTIGQRINGALNKMINR